MFWEQYMSLRLSLATILACVFLAALVLVSLILLSVYAAVIVILSVLASLAQIFGAMTVLGIQLSAIPSVILILSVGMMLCFNVLISLVSPYCKILLSDLKLTASFPPKGLHDLRGQSTAPRTAEYADVLGPTGPWDADLRRGSLYALHLAL